LYHKGLVLEVFFVLHFPINFGHRIYKIYLKIKANFWLKKEKSYLKSCIISIFFLFPRDNTNGNNDVFRGFSLYQISNNYQLLVSLKKEKENGKDIQNVEVSAMESALPFFPPLKLKKLLACH
jgi:hypothetical protein